jgi:hypothetical protein
MQCFNKLQTANSSLQSKGEYSEEDKSNQLLSHTVLPPPHTYLISPHLLAPHDNLNEICAVNKFSGQIQYVTLPTMRES